VIFVVATMVLTADFTWGQFDRRQIGIASLEDYDVRARTRLFPLVLGAAVGTFALLAWLLPRLQRRTGRELFAAVDAAFLPCVLLTFLYTFRQYSPGAWALPPTFAVLILTVWGMERAGLRNRRATDLGRDALWLGSTAFAFLLVMIDVSTEPVTWPSSSWSVPLLIFLGGIVIYLVRWLVSRRAAEDAARAAHDRFVHAASALAALPICAVLHRELFLVLNNRGVTSVDPGTLRIAVFAGLVAWIAWRFVRGPRLVDGARLDVERVLGRCVFPWLLVGMYVVSYWEPAVWLSDDFFESGNPALFVQQWADFGKVPFVEVFNAHGLSDTLFAFLDRIVSGIHRPSWQLYDYLYSVTAGFAVFHLVRRVLGSAASAMFVWMALPYVDQLFHPVPVHGVVLVFGVVWIARRSSVAAWWAFGLLLAFSFAWRLDIGFAGTIATVITILSVKLCAAAYRIPWRGVLIGAAATAVTTLAVIGGVCALSGHSLSDWLSDMALVTNSNQGFGLTRIAEELTEVVLWHLYVLPLLMIALGVWLVARSRGRLDLNTRAGFVFVACIFLSAFTLANFPRGLVRHTFLEQGMAMTSAFTMAVIAFSPAWIFDAARQKTIFTAFVLISSLLAFNFDLNTPDGRRLQRSGTRFERSVLRAQILPRVEASTAMFDRAPMSERYRKRHLERIGQFIDAELTADQTFFDLSSSPLLYYHLRRPSPHWLNHLLLAYDDGLQKRALEEWGRWDTPVLLMPFSAEMAQSDGVFAWDTLDSVEMRLRQFRLYEHAYAFYQPYGQIDRWPVWTRRDWMQTMPPVGDDVRTELTWTPAGSDRELALEGQPSTRVVIQDSAPARVEEIPASWKRTRYVKFVGTADVPTTLKLEWSTGDGERFLAETRTLKWPREAQGGYYLLPGHKGERTLKHFTVRAGPGLDLERVELLSVLSRESFDITQSAQASDVSSWGHLARLWGEHDPEMRRDLPVLRTLHDFQTAREPSFHMALDATSDAGWNEGFAREGVAIRLERDLDAAGVKVGDWVLIGERGRHRVNRIDGRVLYLEGGPLERGDVEGGVIRLHPERMSKLDLVPHSRAHLQFDYLPPLDERARGQYLELRLAAHATDPNQHVVVDYGQGAENRGRFVFRTLPDGAVHTYVLRLSTQANWATRSKEWISLGPDLGSIRLESARILEAVE